MDSSLVVTILGAAVSAVTALILIKTQRRKLGAEADSVVVSAASQMIHDLQSEVARLCKRLEELEANEQASREAMEVLETEQKASRAEIELLQRAVGKLKQENADLRARVGMLEAENKTLREENARLRRPPPIEFSQ